MSFFFHSFNFSPFQILALVAVRKGMDYLFSQHDLSFLDDVIPEKDKKKKEDEKKKKKKKGSLDSDNDDVRSFLKFQSKTS
jgi:sodium bicarbonate cotransporter 4